jgi:hypothetical protein
MDNYPTAVKQGWKILPVSQMVVGVGPYRNAADDDASVTSIDIAAATPSTFPIFTVSIPAISSSTTNAVSSSSASAAANNATASIKASTTSSSSSATLVSTTVESNQATSTFKSQLHNGSRSLRSEGRVSPFALMFVALPIAVAAELLVS